MLLNLLVSTAFAQTAAPAAGQPSMLEAMMPMVVIIGVFYFLVIRPNAKRAKEQQKFVNELKKGDDVVTNFGVLGRVEGLTEQIVTLEIADGVRIKVLRSQVAGAQNFSNQEGKK